MPTVTIDQEKCTKCETCIDVCPMEVFVKKDEKVLAENQKDCIECRACEVQCPEGAITVEGDD